MTRFRVHLCAGVVPNEFGAIRVTPNTWTTLEEAGAFGRVIARIATKGVW